MKETSEIKTSKLRAKLEHIYKDTGNDWVWKNYYPISRANLYGVMICGSIGASIATGKPNKSPGDIDFVATSIEDALNFANDLHIKLSKYSIYYKVMHNSKTTFCPESCNYHIRIYCPTWLPICIFVVPESESWTYLDRYLIQKPKQIEKAAEEISKRDNIIRGYFEDELEDDLPEGFFEDHPDDLPDDSEDDIGVQLVRKKSSCYHPKGT